MEQQHQIIKIVITPLWWKTWWAIAIYILLAVIIIWTSIRLKVAWEIKKKRLNLALKESEDLRKLDKVKARFFSNVAHELRSPLSLILGPAEQLRGQGDPEKDKLVDIINKNAANMLNLTDQLLDMAKLEAGVLKPKLVWGDVISVISGIVNAFSEEAESKNVDIIFKAPAMAEVLFSINTLNRIMYNLLSNALKFTSAGDRIIITVSKSKNGLSMNIEDTGTGIPTEEIPHIFNRYYSGNQNYKGYGIGLSLVKELVDLHEGQITVTSRTEKPSGTKFFIWLPFSSNREVNTDKPNDVSDQEKPTILLVDDHKELAAFIANSVRHRFNVIIASDGNEGLQLLREKTPDLIVSDITMKPMDGIEFCRIIKNDITVNHIPLILLTGRTGDESMREGLACGANDYITKPFSITELNLKISNLLQLQKQLRDHLHLNIIEPEKEPSDKSSPENEFLATIHGILEENLDNHDFGVEQLAGLLFISRSSLHRKTKTLFNLTPVDIIKIYRIKKSLELLKKGYAVSEVAYMTGFNTSSYFIKCFRDIYKTTPTQYLSGQ